MSLLAKSSRASRISSRSPYSRHNRFFLHIISICYNICCKVTEIRNRMTEIKTIGYYFDVSITFYIFLNSFRVPTFVYMNDREIKKRIEEYRRARKYSQADLAEKLAISQAAYYKIEKGDTSLISDHLSKIASALDISDEALVLGYDPIDRDSYDRIISDLKRQLEEKDRRIAELESSLSDKMQIIRLQEQLLQKN